MARSRFARAQTRLAARVLIHSLPAFTLFAARPLWAQTTPVFEAGPAADAPAASAGALLLEESFDFDLDAAQAPTPSLQVPPSSFAIAAEPEASGSKALKWNYALGTAESRLSWSRTALLDLSSARSVSLNIKSAQPTAVEIWFETDTLGAGAESVAARYSTTVWSLGKAWQTVNLDRARFGGREIKGGVLQKDPMPSALWEGGWSHIARWGVSDASNFWRLFAGQVRENGPRTLWLDELKISTAPSTNSVTPAPQAPRPAPAPTIQDEGEEEEEDAGAGGNNQGREFPQGGREFPQDGREGAGQYGGAYGSGSASGYGGYGGYSGYGGYGGYGGDGPGQDQGAEAPAPAPAPVEIEVQAVVQDSWGALESWIPINGETQALEGARAGLKWSVVRLANRDAMLISPVNAETLRAFPPESVRRRPRGAGVVIQGAADRLLRLAIAVTSSKRTAVQVALHESGGGVWTALVPLDMRRKNFVPIVNIADFVNAPTRRDANGQIDLDRIVAVSLQDIGAQKTLAGPNELTLRGMTWIY